MYCANYWDVLPSALLSRTRANGLGEKRDLAIYLAIHEYGLPPQDVASAFGLARMIREARVETTSDVGRRRVALTWEVCVKHIGLFSRRIRRQALSEGSGGDAESIVGVVLRNEIGAEHRREPRDLRQFMNHPG